MGSLLSWFLGFGLVAGVVAALPRTVGEPAPPDWFSRRGLAWPFGVGCFLSLVGVSLIGHWPIPIPVRGS